MSSLNWKTARAACLTRDEGTCRRCLRPATDCHHRKAKGLGGTSDNERNYGMANLVSLCRTCHTQVHANPAESYRLGWLIHSWENPEDIPVPGEVKYEF